MNRRKFLLTLLLGLGLTGIYLPRLFNSKKNHFDITYNGKRLIIIHLDGGNDGLFTIVPKMNDIINAHRKSLMKEFSSGIIWDGDLLLNKHLGDFADLFSKGWLSILPNVGYPEPNTSHFVSSEIWATGTLPSKDIIPGKSHYIRTKAIKGWIGKLIQENRLNIGSLNRTAISFESGRPFILQAGGINQCISYPNFNRTSIWNRDILKLIHQNVDDFIGYERIHEELKTYLSLCNLFSGLKPSDGYTKTAFGKKLATISTMIKKQKPFKVFHIKHDGYDTHLGQIHRLNNLYSDLGSCLKTFAYDLNRIGEWGNTQILVYSEFGRSIDENINGGTDHGTAGPVFVLGGEQIYGSLANIKPVYETYTVVHKPYLQYQIDYRDIFDRVIGNWLT